MLTEETRTRLRQLSRRRDIRAVRPPATSARQDPLTAISRPADVTAARGLEAGQAVATPVGAHWAIRRQLLELWPAAARQLDSWAFRAANSRADAPPDIRAFCEHFPARSVFLDLETCGFAGSTIFLAGLLHEIDGHLTLTQLWARNYAEEKPLLWSLRECLQDQLVLVTFNGKCFDWPQVRDRSILHAKSPDCGLPQLVHWDLLHAARRRWKHQLPNCRLQTLERYICGRQRTDDLPGRDIPAAYQQYVRTGNTQPMGAVLHHNALDLVTLLQLALRVTADLRPI